VVEVLHKNKKTATFLCIFICVEITLVKMTCHSESSDFPNREKNENGPHF
jgi:hypothetical protein